MSKLRKLSHALEALSEYSGRWLGWLVPVLTLIVVYDVSMRYLFREGSVALQELEWHLFSLIFLLGAAYTFKHNGHVRVDIFYQRLGERGRLWVDTLGDLLFLLPLCLVIIQGAWPFVADAYLYGERSPDPGGLPFRYLIKAAIPAGFFLLMLQGIANVLKNLTVLLRVR